MKPSYTIIAAFAILTAPTLFAEDTTKPKEKKETEVVKKEEVKPYPLDTCLVSGEKLGEMGEPYVFVYQGQEIKMCCKDCKKKFDKDPAKYLKKLAEKK